MLLFFIVCLSVLLICAYLIYPLVIDEISSIKKPADNKDEQDLITNLLQNLASDFLQSKISEAEYQKLAKPLKQKLSSLRK